MGLMDIVLGAYETFASGLSPKSQIFVNLIVLTLVVVGYTLFMWKFYVFISTKNIIEINLKKYNRFKEKNKLKFLGGSFYALEYIIIIPVLISFWFAAFALLLALMTRGLETGSVVLIAAITLAAIRVITYLPVYGEGVSKEIAKIIPITFLGLAITNPAFFNAGEVLNRLMEIPAIFGEIQAYLVFIIFIEIFMRILNSFILYIKNKYHIKTEEEKTSVEKLIKKSA